MIKLIKQWFEERRQKKMIRKFYKIRIDAMEEYRKRVGK